MSSAGSIHLVVIGVPPRRRTSSPARLRALRRHRAANACPPCRGADGRGAGLPDFEVTTWYGVLAPAGTPRPVVARLNASWVNPVQPGHEGQAEGHGHRPGDQHAEEFAAYLRQETAKWANVALKSGLKAD